MFDPIMQVEDDLTTTLIQQTLTSPNPAQIVDVPGLYISDISIPSSPATLQEYGFTHVLSLMSTSARPKIPPSLGIVHKLIQTDDDALGNLLAVLKEACGFIDNALEVQNNGKESRVLVHCLQGISRSGAVVVAYLMRALSMPYTKALELARKYRPIITINSGFEKQLRLWERMGFELYEDGDGVGEDGNGGERKEKALYTEWKDKRKSLFEIEGEDGEALRNRERTKSVASVAARFGKRRMDLKDGTENEEGGG